MVNGWQEDLQNLDRQLSFNFNEEFSRNGLFCVFLNKIRNGESIDIQTLQREIVLSNCIGNICAVLNEKASETSIA